MEQTTVSFVCEGRTLRTRPAVPLGQAPWDGVLLGLIGLEIDGRGYRVYALDWRGAAECDALLTEASPATPIAIGL